MDYSRTASKMTVRQRAFLLSGQDFWHINALPEFGVAPIMLSDGPNGLRKISSDSKNPVKSIKTVCYPASSATACSWNRDAVSIIGDTLAKECKSERVSVILGPGINTKRTPLCGRNFEYYSEDPVLSGELAASYINAVQSEGIGTSLKHFACNNTETKRMKSNSLVDERALREIYLRGFEIAVKKSQPWTIMAAYNRLNGTYCTENSYLLDEILRKEWGFNGLVVSDWEAVNDRVAALKAGLSLEMPSSGYFGLNKIVKAYRDNVISDNELNTAASRVIELTEKAEHQLKKPVEAIDFEAHHDIAKKIARDCMVLLKNDDEILPLRAGKKIAVIGERAKKPMYQGFGSSRINSYKVDNAFDAMKKLGADIEYSKGYSLDDPDCVMNTMIDRAVAVAKSCDVTVLFVSCSEMDVCEGFERTSMDLPVSQTALINAVCDAVPNTVVVLSSGSAVLMPWIKKPKALIQTYLLGEAGGDAVADVLLGRISPSGKLAETYPAKFEDIPCLEHMTTDEYDNVEYRESIFTGYRYYDTMNIPVLFPFGYGLTYTRFEYSGIKLSSDNITENDTLTVTCNIKNAGDFDAAEIVQLYVSCPESKVFRAKKELKDFTKVYIKKGETKQISFEISRNAFEYYCEYKPGFVVESADYTITVGSSSADEAQKATVSIESSEDKAEFYKHTSKTRAYKELDLKNITEDDFEHILNYRLSDFRKEKNIERLTSQNSLSDAVDTKYGGKAINALEKLTGIISMVDPVNGKLIMDSVADVPIKRFSSSTHGAVADDTVRAIVYLLNSSDIKGTLQLAARGVPEAVMNLIPPFKK